MKITLIVFATIFITVCRTQTQKQVLFIGNSYTSVNNLPELIKSLATADGNTLIFDANIPGGSQLNQHATSTVTLDKIRSSNWDFVVLQEQSQMPAFPDASTSVYPYATILIDSIYSNNECSIPLFYNTYGRKDGDPQWEGIDTFEKMNARLFTAYSFMAAQAEGMLSPVGIGFQSIKQDGNAIVPFNDLYAGDGSHPTMKGSYLAACIFNNIIFSTTSNGNSFLPSGINNTEATFLQEVADHVVYSVDSVRTDYRPLSNNHFSISINDGTVQFSPTISNGTFDFWDFGDGNTSTDINALHFYNETGSFTAWLHTKNDCYSDSIGLELNVTTLGIEDQKKSQFKVYPNPSTNGEIHIEKLKNEVFSVYTILGEKIYEGKDNFLSLNKGVYLIQHNHNARKIIVL